MEKLKLEHLAPYLPYGLRMIFKGKGGREIILSSITNQGKYGVVISGGTGSMWLNSCGFKPILRPLSDLIKEIEHNGWSFTFSEVYLGNSKIAKIIGVERSTFDNFLNDIDYSSIQLLFKYHFDVFGLIDKGLAIDINTI